MDTGMNRPTRRNFLITLAGVGAAGLSGLMGQRKPAFAASDSAGQFANRLRLPGASGLYAAVAAKDVKQITVSELDFEVLPRIFSPFWAYGAAR
jgi:hypothetical protein